MNLVDWTLDTEAVQTSSPTDTNDVETVAVRLSAGLLGAPKLFVQVRATE